MVVDTCVLLALIFDQQHAAWAEARLNEHAAELRMSTVNLAETLILIRDRQPQLHAELEEAILESGVRFVPPTVEHARIAAEARLRFPLNLGDCFAYALARSEGCALLTLDAGFRRVDVPVISP